MSESSVPFQGPSATPRESGPPVFEAEGSGSRNHLVALGGVAAVVLLAMVGYFVFVAGGSEEPAAALPSRQVPVTPADTATEAPAVVQRLSAKTFGRDPFEALIVEAESVEAVGGTGDSTTTGTSATTGTSTTTGGSTTEIGGSGTGTGTTGGTAAPVTPTVTADHTFRVVSVYADHSRVTVRVDGKKYSGLKAGEVFASYFKVVVIGGKVNGFQFGDEKFSVFGTRKLHIAA